MTIFRSILLCYVVLTLCSAITTTTTLSAAEDSSSSSITLGTTIVAVQFDAGVIVAADTRTSQQGTFVSHRWATKIAAVAPLVTVARAGSAAATQHVLEAWERSSSSSSSSSTCVDVTHVAHWFRRHVRDDSNNNEKRSFLIAGMEQQQRSSTTTTSIPRIYSLSASGALVREDHVRYACNGSGSSFAMAYLDEHSTNDDDETTALEHCRRAIEHAAYRDPSSGGCLRYRIVRTNGTSTHGTLPLLRRVAASSETKDDEDDDALPGFAAPVRRPFPMVTKSKSVV